MNKYRIYRTFEMYGYQDFEAETPEQALQQCRDYEEQGDDEPEYWQMDGWGSPIAGPQFQLYMVNGRRV